MNPEDLEWQRKLRHSAVDITIIALGSDVVHSRIYLNWFGKETEWRELYDNQNCFHFYAIPLKEQPPIKTPVI